jgi:hypothetical protein
MRAGRMALYVSDADKECNRTKPEKVRESVKRMCAC